MPGVKCQSGHRLTRRERAVLQQAAHGLSNRQIGEELEIAEQTVKNHLSNAMRKLSIRDRTSAVVIAIGQGLIAIPEAALQDSTGELAFGGASHRISGALRVGANSPTGRAETSTPTD